MDIVIFLIVPNLEGEDNIMKKLMIGLLTAVTIMGMSAQAFAADLYTQKSNQRILLKMLFQYQTMHLRM